MDNCSDPLRETPTVTLPRRRARRLAAALVVLPLAGVGILGTSSAASAQPTETSTASPTTSTGTLGPTGPTFGPTPTTSTRTATSSTTTSPRTSPSASTSSATTRPSSPGSATGTGSGDEPASVTNPTAPSSDHDAPLTPEQVRAQLAQAESLRAQLAATDVGLSAAMSALQLLGQQVSTALQQRQTALAEERTARADQARQQERLKSLRASLVERQDALGRWARTAYTVGGPMATYETWLAALEGSSATDVGHDLALLRQVGVLGSDKVQELRAATTLQQVAAREAGLAAARAEAARLRAEGAATRSRELLGQQRQALARLQSERARIIGSDQLAAQQRSGLQRVQAGLTLPTGSCAGRDTSTYANGTIPAAALCPLWGAPGQLLRADAAAAFERLAKAYAAEFASPLCVTDSYRPLAEQVRVFAAKPTLAARPGTSNHGWGTALDLCGGIQSFGTSQHLWMQAHAPLYGWFHPAWAEPTGSKPEPWHWEFGG
jgi:hypothetical protein